MKNGEPKYQDFYKMINIDPDKIRRLYYCSDCGLVHFFVRPKTEKVCSNCKNELKFWFEVIGKD